MINWIHKYNPMEYNIVLKTIHKNTICKTTALWNEYLHSHLENEILFPIEKIVRFYHCKVCKENFIIRKTHIFCIDI